MDSNKWLVLLTVRIYYRRNMSRQSETKQLKALGNRIATVRRERGVTQEQLAEKTGFTSITIGYIEQGRRSPRIATVFKIAECLKVPVAELFKGL
jgi:DNA-binding XRE family transcriptional regulator